MSRHVRDQYFIVGEGLYTKARRPESAGLLAFNDQPDEPGAPTFVRTMPVNPARLGEALLQKVGDAMAKNEPSGDTKIPAGFTYLGQFVDHDLTLDETVVELGEPIEVEKLRQGRTPTLELDSVYGHGPVATPQFYDGARLKVGTTAKLSVGKPAVTVDRPGYDLPRLGAIATSPTPARTAQIPDTRNDENLIVAQTHLAFIRFHNFAVDKLAAIPEASRFEAARTEVIKHYQWMLRTDFLPRIVDSVILDAVFAGGTGAGSGSAMPIEFSVAAYRMGHSMVRGGYTWNSEFPGASLAQLFQFSGTSGNMAGFDRLPTNWTVDWRRLHDFEADAGRADLKPPTDVNRTKALDVRLVNPLAALPFGSFGETAPSPLPNPPLAKQNLAVRNLLRGEMLSLASGQQAADHLGVAKLTPQEVLSGAGKPTSLDLKTVLDPTEQDAFTANTPLWFYILREAEMKGESERLGPLGSQIVARTFFQAMADSESSIVKDTAWRPTFGPDDKTFKMVHLLFAAFGTTVADLAPIG